MFEPISLTIKGQPPRKSNSRRIVTNRKTGRPMVIKSKNALDWMKAAIAQVPASARLGVGSPKESIAITFHVRYANRRPDLSIELVLDMLQKAGVIRDDRYVFVFHAYKWIDKNNPGVDILIEPICYLKGEINRMNDQYFIQLLDYGPRRQWEIPYAPVAYEDKAHFQETIIPRLTPEFRQWVSRFCKTFLAAEIAFLAENQEEKGEN